MDAHVDAGVGDSITYRLTAAGPPLESAPGTPTIPGFIRLTNQEGGFGRISPHDHRWFAKVHKQYLPDGVDIRHRIDHPKLDGVTMRPAADTIDDDGDYYLFDLQKA